MKPEWTQPPDAEPGSHRFHAMVKPSGAACNLDCSYCFYLHKTELLGQAPQPRMSDEVLEQHIRQYIEAQTGEEVIFSWQGGEPTLMGLDFFRKVVRLQGKYRRRGQRIENDLQTNGVLLDADWAIFLKQNNFLVGLSIDGPREFHDRHRLSKGGQETFDRVMAAATLLKKYKVPFNALCCVNRDNAKHPVEIYRFLTEDLGVWRVQFIPIVEPKVFKSTAPQHWGEESLPVIGTPAARPGTPDSIVTDWTVDPDDWGRFLAGVWDYWHEHDLGRVHVNWFETAVAQSLGMPSQQCVTAEFCGKGIAVEFDGDVYSCDHYVYPEFRLGNIRQKHLGEMAYSPRQEDFGYAKRDTLPRACVACRHLNLCWGECPKNRLLRTRDGEPGLNFLCAGFLHFFDHIQRDLPAILRHIRGAGWG